MNPVVGFRTWAVREDGLLAPWSIAIRHQYPDCWASGEATAANDRGLHAWRSPAAANALEMGLRAGWGCGGVGCIKRPWFVVEGACVAWGRVVLHEHGFTAQLARAICLLRSRWETQMAEAAGRRYGVPVVETEEDLIAVATEHGDLYVPEGAMA